MKASLDEYRTDGSDLPRDPFRQRESLAALPSLPDDCRPEVGSRSTVSREATAEGPSPRDPREITRADVTEITETLETAPTPGATFEHLLRSLLRQTVTIVNSESYEEAPVGHRICAAFDRAKLVSVGKDYVLLASEFVHRGKGPSNGEAKEPIRHCVPIAKIKRISLLATESLIHI